MSVASPSKTIDYGCKNLHCKKRKYEEGTKICHRLVKNDTVADNQY